MKKQTNDKTGEGEKHGEHVAMATEARREKGKVVTLRTIRTYKNILLIVY